MRVRVVSNKPDFELTLIADQPTPMHSTTRLSDAAEGRTRFQGSFLWEEPAGPDVATTRRQTMEGTAIAGEADIKQAFES